jgi:hypothetical protein
MSVSVSVDVDIKLLQATIRDTQSSLRETELSKAFERGAKLVIDERISLINREGTNRTGHFAKAGKTYRRAGKGIAALPGSHDKKDYIGVHEFGGMIPRHQGKAPHQRFTMHRPPATEFGLGSYYLYPAFEKKKDEIVDEVRKEIQNILNDHSLGDISGYSTRY